MQRKFSEKSPNKKLPVSAQIAIVIIVVVALFLCTVILSDTNDQTQSENNNSTMTPSIGYTDDTPTIGTENNSQPLIDNDFVTVTFVDVFESPGIDSVFYLQLEVKNKTEKTVWVSLQDSSVNDYMAMAMSGVPTIIEPGKISTNPVFFSYASTSITSLDELTHIEFSVNVSDNDSLEELYVSEKIIIEFP